MTKLVEWDAGHGGKDPGASGHGVVEKDVALRVATEAARRLERDYEGVKCLLTRSSDVYLSLNERTDKANSARADVLISVHCNAGGGAGGFESYTYSGTKDTATAALQDAIHTEIMSRLQSSTVLRIEGSARKICTCAESRVCLPS